MKINFFVFILVSLIVLVFDNLHQTNGLESTRIERKYSKAIDHDRNKSNISNDGHR